MATLTVYAGTSSEYVVTPVLVLGWEQRRSARVQVHPVLNRQDPDVTVRPAAAGTGTLSLFFDDIVAALDAAGAHADNPGPWYFDAAPDEPYLTMWYVTAGGDIGFRIDLSGRAAYVVEVPYQVVSP